MAFIQVWRLLVFTFLSNKQLTNRVWERIKRRGCSTLSCFSYVYTHIWIENGLRAALRRKNWGYWKLKNSIWCFLKFLRNISTLLPPISVLLVVIDVIPKNHTLSCDDLNVSAWFLFNSTQNMERFSWTIPWGWWLTRASHETLYGCYFMTIILHFQRGPRHLFLSSDAGCSLIGCPVWCSMSISMFPLLACCCSSLIHPVTFSTVMALRVYLLQATESLHNSVAWNVVLGC